MTQKTKRSIWILIGLGAILTLGLLLRNDPAAENDDTARGTTSANEAAPASDSRSRDEEPRTVRNPEDYAQQLHETGRAYQQTLAREKTAARTLEAYEREHRRDTAERAALADEIDALNETIAKKKDQAAEIVAAHPRWKALEAKIAEAEAKMAAIRPEIAEAGSLREKAAVERAAYEQEHLAEDPERQAIADEIEQLRETSRELYRQMRSSLEERPEWRALNDRKQAIERRMEAAEPGEGTEELAEERRRILTEIALLERSLESDPKHREILAKLNETHAAIRAAEKTLRERYRDDPDWQSLQQAEEAARAEFDARLNGLREASTTRQELFREKAALERDLARELPEAGKLHEEIDALQNTVEEKQAALRETFADDPEWKALQEKLSETQADREARLKKVQSLVRERMRAEATRRSENERETTR